MRIFERSNKKTRQARQPESQQPTGRRPLYAFALEQRLMFDGAVAATAADVAVHDVPTATDQTAQAVETKALLDAAAAYMPPVAEIAPPADVALPVPETAQPSASVTASHEVLFVDGRVQDYQAVVAAAAPSAEVVVLDPYRDGVVQIAEALQGRTGIDSIGIVSHGDSGLLLLGDVGLFNGNIDKYTSELQTIGNALTANGDILLYGCDVGAGSGGQAFIDTLASITGADVVASTDGTGAARLGGDWNLEITTGAIDYSSALDVSKLSNYDYLLHTANVNSVAQLKDAIATGNADGSADTITLTGNITFASASDAITINVTDGQTMTIVGGGFTLDAAYFARAINVAGGTVEIDNLTITHGVSSGNGANNGAAVAGSSGFGGGISNAGTLTLNSVTVTANAATGGGGGGGVAGATVGGGGGGGSGANGVGGGTGGSAGPGTGNYAGVTGSAGNGGRGGSYDGTNLGGRGGTTSGGGAGGTAGAAVYAAGGAGATATAGGLTVGGGGGGSGWDANGGTGGNAAGAIYNSGTLTIIGTSAITNNLGAAGGGGGGGGSGNHGGLGGRGVGAIWNAAGTVRITSANYAAMTGNAANSGTIGAVVNSGNNTGFSSPAAVAKIYNGSGTVDTAYVLPPTVTDGNISLSGASGAFKIGDTVTATWNNTAGGDNNSGITGVTVNFSAFGGGAAVAANESSGTWTATYTIVSGAIDGINKNVSVTATNGAPATTADTSNATLDNVAPTVSDGNISLSGASGAGGAFKIGDTVTATWNNTAGGDNNADTISGATVDFSAFGGGAAVAANESSGTWTATYTIVSGAIDGTNKNVSVTATDNAGNTTTTADTTNATVDNVAPTVSNANISISGASGAGGAFKIGDTVTATWNNTAGGDNNTDILSGATVDFSAFGGGAAVAANESSGTWTATYAIVSGAIDGTNKNVSMTVTDNAGNTTTTADTTNATVDNVAPTVTSIVRQTPSAATTNADTLVYRVTFSEAVSNLDTADFSVSGTTGTVTNVASAGGNAYDVTVSGGDLANYNGTVTLSFAGGQNITDSIGNALTATTPTGTNNPSYTVDNAAPSAPSTPDMTAGTDSGASNTDNITNSTTPTFTGTAEAGATVTLYDTDGTTSLGTATATGGSWSITASALSAGAHTITAKATDAAGNVSLASTGLPVVIDTTNPVITINNGTPFAYTENDSAAALDVTATLTEAGSPGSSVLTVQITASNEAADTLSLPTGTDSGINIDGSNNLRSGTTNIGTVTVSSVTNGTTWTITFLSSATQQNIQDTIAAIRYHNTSDNPGTSNRTVSFNLTDGAGNSATAATRTVAVTAVNDAPTAISPTTGMVSTYDSADKTVATLTATDADHAAWTFAIQSITHSTAGTVTNDNTTFYLGAGGSVASNTLVAKTPSGLNTTGTYTIVVRATDAGSLFRDETITVTATSALIVTTTADEAAGTTDYTTENTDGTGLSLREAVAIAAANSGGTISFATGNGTLSLGSALTISENITLDVDSIGTLSLSGSAITIASGKTLTISNGSGDTATIANPIGGAGGLTKTGVGTLTLSGANTYTGTTTVSVGTLAVSGGSAIADTGTVDVASGATFQVVGSETLDTLSGTGGVTVDSGQTLTLGNGGVSYSFGGVISGAGGLTKTGSGTLTLTGANTYTGTTTVSAGTLELNNSSGTALADGSAVSVAGTLTLLSASETIGALSGAGTVNLGANALTVSQSTNTSFSGAIDGSGSLIKSGSGTLTLSGTHNDQTWGLTVSGGAVSVASSLNLGNHSVTLNGGGLTLTGASTFTNAISLTGAGTLTADAAATWSGVISGSGTLAKAGASLLTLSGNNTYTGATTVSVGPLLVTHNNALGTTGADTTVASGATLRIGNGLTVAENLTLSGIGVSSGIGALKINEGSGSATVSGTITLAADADIGAYNSGDTLTLSGVISGGFALTKVGSGTVVLSGDNTYTGATTVSTGTLVAAHNNALGTTAGSTTVSSGASLGLLGGVTVAEAVSAAGTGVSSAGAIYNISGTNTLSGNVTLTGASDLGVASGQLTISGNIGGSFNITKAGAGTLVLSGSNTYTGTTTVSAGALSVAADGNLGSGTVTLADGTTLAVTGATTINNAVALSGNATLDNSAAVTLSGAISGAGTTLTKSGAGTLTLSSTSNSSATTTALTVTAGTLSVGAATTMVGGTVTLSGGNLTITGSGDTYANAITLSAAATITNANAATLSGAISGSAALAKDGAGKLTLDNTSNSGAAASLTVSAGTLSVASDTRLVGGTVTLTGGSTLNLANTAGDIDNAIVLGTGNVTVSVTNGAATLSGIISGDGSLTKTGNPALTLSGNNSYTGGTTIRGTNGVSITGSSTGAMNLGTGAVTLESSSTLTITGTSTTVSNDITLLTDSNAGTTATITNANAVTLSGVLSGAEALTKAGAGTLTLTGTNTHSGAVTVSVGGLTLIGGSSIGNSSAVTVASGATLTLGGGGETIGSLAGAGSVVLGSYNLKMGGDNTSTTFSGVISGSAIEKTGTGTLTLSGANTYTGSTTVSAGTLALSGGSAIADTSAVTVLNSGTLSVSGTETVGSITGAGAIVLVGSGTLAAGGNNTSTTFSGVISGSGGGSLTKQGTGELTLSGANTYNGGTTISGGTITAGSTGALGASGVDLAAGTTLNFAVSGSFGNYIALSGSATLNVGSGYAVTLSNTIDGAFNLTKTGTGTLTVSGATTYSGTTTVSAGTLLVTGSLGATSSLSVASGATLGGTGSIFAASSSYQATIMDDATLSPGIAGTNGGAGKLTVNGNLRVNGTLVADIGGTTAGTNYDQVAVTGTVAFNSGPLTVTLASGYTPALNDTYILVANDDATPTIDAITGAFSGVAEGARIGSLQASYKTTVNGSGNDFTLTMNNTPPTAANGSVTTNEDTAYTFTAANFSFSDVDTDASVNTFTKVQITALPSSGTFKLNNTAVTLNQEILVSDIAAGKLTFSPAADANGSPYTTFQFKVHDGAEYSSSAYTETINVSPVNDPASISGTATGSVTEDGTATAGATLNVVDVDNGGFQEQNTVAGAYGSFSLASSGVWTYTLNNSSSVVQALAAGQSKTDSFAAVSADGTASQPVTVTINGANDAPVAVADTGAATEAGGSNNGTTGINPTGNVLTNDTDLDSGDSKTVSAISGGTVGGATSGSYGSLTLNSDGSYSYTVDNANAAVQALKGSGNTLTDSFTYTVQDSGGLTGSATLTVTLQGANDAPVGIGDTAIAVEAGGIANSTAGTHPVGNVLSNDTDVDSSDTKTVSAITGGTVGSAKVGTYGSLILNNDGSYSYTVNNANASVQALRGSGNTLTDTFSYTVKDAGGLTGTASLIVTLQGANDAPVAVADTAIAVEAEGIANATAGINPTGNVLSNDTDVDSGDTKIVSAITGGTVGTAKAGSYGTLTLNSDGSYSYIVDNANASVQALNSGDTLTDSVTYTVRDTGGLISTATLTVTLKGANDAPTLTSGATGTVAENAPISTVVYTATAADVDAGQTLTYSLSGADAAAFAINASSGAVTLNVPANFETKASYNVNVIATDNGSGLLNDTKAITVTVTDVNEAPKITSGATASVTENSAVDTVVYTASATDVDAGTTLSYSLSGADADLLSIDASSGAVTLKSAANFETKASYSFNVIATDSGTGTLNDTKAITVAVINVNEAPKISSGATGSVAENAPADTVVYTVTASDVDAGQILNYSLSGADADLLNIDAVTGAVTLKTSANFEVKPSYSFNVIAKDSGTGNLSDTKAVILSVTDVNEAPKISSGATGSVAENAPADTVVYTVTASDVDAGQILNYSLSGADADLLNIDAVTGAVTLKTSANFEVKPSYSFNVIAKDNGTGSLSDTKAVILSVTDVNEAPKISSGATAGVTENSAVDTVVYTATVTDVDAGTTLSYSLSGADADLLSIDAGSGAVTLNSAANFEEKSSYSFNVIATDNGTLSDSRAVTLNVTDVNEAPTISSGATAGVAENSAISAVVYTASATDVDAGTTLSYSLSGADAALLSIDAGSGAVTLNSAANFEAKSSYSFNVLATDNGTLSDSRAVTLNVTDVNEAPTISSGATAGVAENSAISAVVYTASATDVDAGTTLSYSLSGADAALLSIDVGSGAVTLKSAANFEAKSSYSFNVIASDGSLSDSRAVTLNVTNVNETPIISSGATAGVTENSAVDTVVYTASATDVDAGTTLSYSLSGADAALLSIDAGSGAVTLKSAANFEAKSSYSFNVLASDGSLSDSRAVTLNVTNVNETPIISSGATAGVTENSAVDTVVYTASATDVDAGTTLSYSLSGADAELLNIDVGSGAVTLKSAANFEAKSSYSFNVIATDGSLSDSRAVILNVTNVNETPIISSGATAGVAENSAVDTVVYTASATDVDAGTMLSYSLSGADAELLSIDAGSGAVTLKSAANFEAKSSYSFNVLATDNGTLSDTKAVTLTVTDVNEAPTISSGATVGVAENLAVDTVVYTAIATDVDAGTTLSYSLSGADAALLSIDAGSGAVTLKSAANFEAKSSYSFNVIATDGSLSDSKAVTLNVTNVNETPIISSGATASVAENSAVDTVVYTASATDVDAGTTLSYSLSGADAELLNIDAGSGAVTLNNPANFEAKSSYSFNVIASDGSLSDTKAVTLTVTDVNEATTNHAPQFTSTALTTATEDQVYSYTLTATDADTSDTLAITAATLPSWLTLTDHGDGTATLTGTPGNDQVGSIDLALQVSDGLASDEQRFTLEVTNVNDAPTTAAALGLQAATQDTAFALTLPVNSFKDVDVGDALTYRATLADGKALPDWLSFDPARLAFNGTPGSLDVTTDSLIIRVIATDRAGAFTTLDFPLRVDSVNHPPVAKNDTAQVAENGTLNVTAALGVLANDSDIDAGDSRVVSAVNGEAAQVGQTITLTGGGKLTLNADGSYQFDTNGAYKKLALGQSATETVTYTIIDNNGLTAQAKLAITITGQNEAPTVEIDKTVVVDQYSERKDTLGNSFGLSVQQPTDLEQDKLSITVTGLPASGAITTAAGVIVALGDKLSPEIMVALRYVPSAGFTGVAGQFIYHVSDGHTELDRAVAIQVKPVQYLDIGPASVTLSEGSVKDGTTLFNFTVYRSGDVAGSAVVHWQVDAFNEAGSAAGGDFIGGELPSGEVSFAPGDISKTLSVAVAADGLVEANENFIVRLTGTSVDDATQQRGIELQNLVATADGVILNDDSLPNIQSVAQIPTGAGRNHDRYFTGDQLVFEVKFDRAVTVSGTSFINLTVGTRTGPGRFQDVVRSAVLVGGSGTDTLRFAYKIQANDVDPNGIQITGPVQSGKLVDAFGNEAVRNFSSVTERTTKINTNPGVVIDGYFTGSTVFADANRNGVLDSGEASDTTDATGNFVILGGDGPYMLVGGTDISTQLPFEGIYQAPPRASVITPLTTLLVGMAGNNADDAAFAAMQAALKTALGIDSEVDILNYDPFYEASRSDAADSDVTRALSTQAEAAKIANLIVQGSAVLSGAATVELAQGEAGLALIQATADYIQARPNTTVDLADPEVVRAILTAAGNALSGVDLVRLDNNVQGAAEVIGAGNSQVDAALTTNSGIEGLTQIAQAQVVAQGAAADALQLGTQNNDLGRTVTEFTGDNLTIAVQAAEVGIVVPVYLEIQALSAEHLEGDSGSSDYSFTVTRSGNTGLAFDVDYTVGGAVDAADFGGTLPSGTIHFKAGETSQTLTVKVGGDLLKEADEAFTVSLGNPSAAATLRVESAEGVIRNDDPRTSVINLPETPNAVVNTPTPIAGISVDDGDSVSLSVTLQVSGGQAFLNGPAAITDDGGILSVSGSVADVNATLNNLVFTGDLGQTAATIKITASDGDSGTQDPSQTLTVELLSPPENALPTRQIAIAGVASEIIGVGVADLDNAAHGRPITVTLTPENGSVAVTTYGDVQSASLSGNRLQLSGSVEDLNNTLASMEFTAIPRVTTALVRVSSDDGDLRTGDASGIVYLDVVSPPENILPTAPVGIAGQATPIAGLSVDDFDSANLHVSLSVEGGTLGLSAQGQVTVTQDGAGYRLFGAIAELNATLATLQFTGAADSVVGHIDIVTSDLSVVTPVARATLDIAILHAPAIVLPSTPPGVLAGSSLALGGIEVSDNDAASLTVTLTATGGSLDIRAAAGATVQQGSDGQLILTGSPATVTNSLATLSVNVAADAGEVTLNVQVDDGDARTPDTQQTLTLAVTQAPDLHLPQTLNVVSGTTVSLPGIAIDDTGAYINTLRLETSGGTIAISAVGDVTVTETGNGVLTITGTARDIDASLAGLQFTGNTGAGTARIVADVHFGNPDWADLQQTLTINIVDAPALVLPVNALVVSQGEPLPITGISVSDADSKTLTVTLTPTNGNLTITAVGGVQAHTDASGRLTLQGPVDAINASLAGLTYSGDSGATEGTIQVQVQDDSDITPAAEGSLSLSIVDLPALTLPSTISVVRGAPVSLFGLHISDRDSPQLTLTLTPVGGSVTFTPSATVTVTQGEHGSIILVGTADDLNASVADLAFTAEAANGVALNIELNDGDPRTADLSANLALTVVSGHPPAAGGDIDVSVADSSDNRVPEDAQPDTANIRLTPVTVSDPDGALPTGIRILDVVGGSLVQADGSAIVFGGAGTVLNLLDGGVELRFSPDGQRDTDASIRYLMVDADDHSLNSGASIATVRIAPVDDAPVISSTAPAVAYIDSAIDDRFAASHYTATATDPDTGAVLTWAIQNPQPTEPGQNTVTSLVGSYGTLSVSGNTFTYTPDPHAINALKEDAADTFTVQVSDGSHNVAQIWRIDVSGANDSPQAQADSYSTQEDTALTIPVMQGVLANDSDRDGDILTTVLVQNPAHGTVTLDADGAFRYTPAAGYQGNDSFRYQSNDGSADSPVVTVVLAVAAVNDAPTANVDNYTTQEDTALTVAVAQGVLANDSDADGDTLSAVLVQKPAHGSLSLNSDGTFSYTPAADYHGSDSFSYQAEDGIAQSNIVIVNLTVASVNDAPQTRSDHYSLSENSVLTIAASEGVLANDTDIDGDTLSAVLAQNPAHGSLSLNRDGSFSYTPDLGYQGSDSFSYRANDGSANGDLVSVALTVEAIANHLPVTQADSYSTAEDTPLTISAAQGVLSNDTDQDGNPLSAMLVQSPSHGTLSLNSDGSFNYSPDANYHGDDRFSYQADDGIAQGQVVSVSLTVFPSNDAPLANPDRYSTAEDNVLTIAAGQGVLSNDSDADGNLVNAELIQSPAHGTLVFNPDGSFSYTPERNYNGEDRFSYRIDDGTVSGNSVTVELTVEAVNDIPLSRDSQIALNAQDTYHFGLRDFPFLDADGDRLQWLTINSLPTGGSLTVNGIPVQNGRQISAEAIAAGALLYSPALSNSPQSVQLSYTVSDGHTDSAGYSLHFDVAQPITSNATQTVEFNGSAIGFSMMPLGQSNLGMQELRPSLTGVDSNIGTTSADEIRITASRQYIPQFSTIRLNAQLGADSNRSFTVPARALFSLDSTSGLAFTASQADGSALPDSVIFDSQKGTLTLKEGASLAGPLTVKITVSDGKGNQVVVLVKVQANHKVPSSTKGKAQQQDRHDNTEQRQSSDDRPQGDQQRKGEQTDKRLAQSGKPGLTEQLQKVGRKGFEHQRLKLLESLAGLGKNNQDAA